MFGGRGASGVNVTSCATTSITPGSSTPPTLTLTDDDDTVDASMGASAWTRTTVLVPTSCISADGHRVVCTGGLPAPPAVPPAPLPVPPAPPVADPVVADDRCASESPPHAARTPRQAITACTHSLARV